MPRPPSSASLEQRIVARVKRAGASATLKLVAPGDLVELGSRRAIDVALHRLVDRGVLRRATRGLYYVPRSHPALGEVRPSADAVVNAFAAKHHLRVQPSGANAANLLGLSEQVPQRLVYLTDGPSREFRYGRQDILLRHTTLRNMATAGRVSGLVIQALRHLGKNHVDENTVKQLRRRLSTSDRKRLRADAKLAPVWIADILRKVAATDEA